MIQLNTRFISSRCSYTLHCVHWGQCCAAGRGGHGMKPSQVRSTAHTQRQSIYPFRPKIHEGINPIRSAMNSATHTKNAFSVKLRLERAGAAGLSGLDVPRVAARLDLRLILSTMRRSLRFCGSFEFIPIICCSMADQSSTTQVGCCRTSMQKDRQDSADPVYRKRACTSFGHLCGIAAGYQ